MQGQRGRNERRAGVFLDMAHLILGIAIVIFAVLSFISPEGNEDAVPWFILLAGAVKWDTKGMIYELKTCARDKKRFRLGIFQLLLGAGLGLLGVLSAVSLWFHG